MIEDVEHPVAGRVHTLGFPLKMSDTPLRVRRAPPLLGEHSAEILRELGIEVSP
ncbi:MAG: CoA transferase [Gemmatimonadaceae bacterium]